MLLEFKTKNFKTFVEETSFSMRPTTKQKELEYSLCEEKINKSTIKGLCSSIIYGPNASGKTNIIAAMEVFKDIILRGNIKNRDEIKDPNASKYMLELIPNQNQKESAPVEFYIDFIEENLHIEYELKIDLGKFLDKNYNRKVILEKLFINKNTIFLRDKNISFGNLKSIKEYITKDAEKNIEQIKSIIQSNINQEDLFLTNGFGLLVSKRLFSLISNWISNKLKIIYRSDSIISIPDLSNRKNSGIILNQELNEATKIFGETTNEIGYISRKEGDLNLCSIIKNDNEKKITPIPVEIFESYGTVRFSNIFPFIYDTLKLGGTLIIDEFDASIHPMALISIINIFHNDEINKKNAQLIFNTHNPIFLNSNIFRRDEIKFIERDEEVSGSEIYSLADFENSTSEKDRKTDDYMKNYFISKYGAIKDIDFTPLFQELLNNKKG